MKGVAFLYCLLLAGVLWAYTPSSDLIGPVKSVRTYKDLLRPIPAGEYEEPWLINADFDSSGRPVTQWFYHMGQEVRRHEFRYEQNSEGRERTIWLSYFMTPDLRPPAERLAGYEHWYTLKAEDNPTLVETLFETVQNHPVKSIFRYYDTQERLIRETDSRSDLEIKLIYDSRGRLHERRGSREDETVWREQLIFDREDRLTQVLQYDLNQTLYQKEEYLYEKDKIIFNKYLREIPSDGPVRNPTLSKNPWFRSIKYYDSDNHLTKMENYRDNGPMGLLLTEENHYTHDNLGQIIKVEEVYRKQIWEIVYDQRGNWIELTFQDLLNKPDTPPIKWYRVIEYYK